MGIFDRFRAQPKWKHSDPGVRLAAVEELSLEEQDLLAALAREDADAHVRRAAIRKVYDPALLKDVSDRDPDSAVRDEAASALLDLAVGAFEDSSESESLKALEHLTDARHLSVVAKTASAESVSLAALSRLSDVKAIGSVARRSVHAATRLQALGRVDEIDEVLAVAMKGDHRDVALAALDRLSDPEHFRAVAARGVQKAAARRARGLVRDVDLAAEAARSAEAAVAARAAAAAAARPNWNAERERVCRAVEGLASERDWRSAEARLGAALAEWDRIGAEAAPDEAQVRRFAEACERARQVIERGRRDDAERATRAEQSGREQAERAAFCESLEAVAAAIKRQVDSGVAVDGTARLEEVPATIEATRTRWAVLSTPSLKEPETEALARRFERAVSACQREMERARQAGARRARLQELAGEAEAAAADQAPGDQRTRWRAIKQEWADLGGAHMAGADLVARFDAAAATFAAREAEEREGEQRRMAEALQHAAQACEQAEAAAVAETLTLKDGDRALRDVRAALDGLGALPRKDRADVAERLKRVQEALFPRVSELREADEWVRWANVGIQEDLCRQAEALVELSDAGEAARQLRELQTRWKQAAAVPRNQARGLWDRFKKAGDEIHARADALFAAQSAEREANLARKEALCEQAEALAESSDWIKTAEAIKRLQAEWTAIGAVPRGREKATWERFRAACDRFFTRRREDLTKRKEEWAANLARKEAFIARVEALPGDADWGQAVEQVKRAQAEWKGVGPVRKNKSDELWARFRAACDAFFERYQQRDQALVSANVAIREAICRELEALVPAPVEQPPAADQPTSGEPVAGELPFAPPSAVEPPAGLRDSVWALRTRWQHAPTVIPRETLAALTARYNAALADLTAAFPAVFTGSALLDPDKVRAEVESLVERAEKALPEPAEASSDSPTTIMAARLREALTGNTLGVVVAEADAKYRVAETAIAEVTHAWATLEPLPSDLEKAFGGRFRQACARVLDAIEKRKK